MTEIHPEKRLIGYARVSTYGQTLDTQLEQLRAAGCTSRNIYREKVTGARPDRRELNRMLGKLAPGDVVIVTRIDRLARSTFDLFAIVKQIVDARAQFRSLAEPWADTGTSTGDLMLAVLGAWGTWSATRHAHRRRQEPHLDQVGAVPNRCPLRGRFGIASIGATGVIGTGTVFRSHMFTIYNQGTRLEHS